MLFYHANQLGIITFHHAVLTVVSVIKRSLRSALFIYFIITGQTVILIVPRVRGRLQGKNYKREFTRGNLQGELTTMQCMHN